jgi:archaellum component FlaC
MKDILMIIIPTIISAIVGWWVGHKKESVDLCGERMDQLEKSIAVYNTIIDDMSKKIDALRSEVIKLETRIQDLMTENKKLKRHNGL